MLNKLNILEIRRDALYVLKLNTNKYEFLTIYYCIPISIAFILHYINYDIETRLFRNLISGISLFAGMLFSIIFIVSKNYNERKRDLQSKNEEDLQYLNRYKKFSNNIISLISFVVIKAILIIVLLIISDAYKHFLDDEVNFQLRLIWDVFVIIIIQFLLYIIVILKEMYAMQYDDINR